LANLNPRTLAAEHPGPIHPSKFAHVVLKTTDLKRARDWYCTLVQGWIGYENDMLCFVTYDDEHHRIGLLAMPGLVSPPPNAYGLEHIAFTYASLGALLANYRRLKHLGIEPYWAINHGPTISMYYRDPDGNKVETQYDVFESAKEATDFINSNYGENFMGIIFDPEEMVASYESGVAVADLVKRPTLPPGLTPWDMHRP
jgi:catechol 2,3-dioxygenase-like lactoylglutathione lyase family enzyme